MTPEEIQKEELKRDIVERLQYWDGYIDTDRDPNLISDAANTILTLREALRQARAEALEEAARAAELRAAISWYVPHVADSEGTDFLSFEDNPHAKLLRKFRTEPERWGGSLLEKKP